MLELLEGNVLNLSSYDLQFPQDVRSGKDHVYTQDPKEQFLFTRRRSQSDIKQFLITEERRSETDHPKKTLPVHVQHVQVD